MERAKESNAKAAGHGGSVAKHERHAERRRKTTSMERRGRTENSNQKGEPYVAREQGGEGTPPKQVVRRSQKEGKKGGGGQQPLQVSQKTLKRTEPQARAPERPEMSEGI